MKSFYLETEYYVAELKTGILHVHYKPMMHITLEDARAIVEYRISSFNNLSVPVLIRIGKVRSVDKEARQYLFTEGITNIKAVAFIEEHAEMKRLAEFLLGVSTPKVPCQSFGSEQEALVWLQQYV